MVSRDSLVAERISRIDATIECRNALLHQLYDLIRDRHNETLLDGRTSTEDDKGLASFLEKLDLRKNPSMGMISQLADSELHDAVLNTITTLNTLQSPPNPPTSYSPTPPPMQAIVDTPVTVNPSPAQSNVPTGTEIVDMIVVPTLPTTLVPISTSTTLGHKDLENGTIQPDIPISEGHGHPQATAPGTDGSVAMDIDQEVKQVHQMSAETPAQINTAEGIEKAPSSTFVPHPTTGNITHGMPTTPPPHLSTSPYTYVPSTPALSGGFGDVRADMFEMFKDPVVPRFEPNYTLPLLSTLPAEFKAKGASRAARQQKKKEKEREKQAVVNGVPVNETVKKEKSEEFVPLGMNRWGAIIRSNPAFKKVSTATKSLTTKDWNIAMMELTVLKTLERIEELKDGKWSFRQPKKQRGVGGLTKTHGDYLLDEMKWMRTDFREERKWKLAVAYALGQSVLDWHSATTPEERLQRGISVFWKKPRTPDENDDGTTSVEVPDQDAFTDRSALAMLNYDSENDEDDDDGDQEKEEDVKESAGEALEAELALAANEGSQDDAFSQIKQEDIEQHVQAGEDAMVVDQILTATPGNTSAEADALKADSLNPMLAASGSTLGEEDNTAMNASKPGSAEVMAYNAIRESVAYSSDLKLFLDDSDIMASLSGFNGLSLEPSIVDIFADLQPYSMLDPPPPNGETEKKKGEKKSERTDPYKRNEDTTFSKLTPVVKMMHCKPTLLGPLQPARRWKGGKWINIDEGPLSGDYERLKAEDAISDLFDTHTHRQYAQAIPPTPRRTREHEWTTQDDALLRSLVEKYFPNWSLVAECFNSVKPSVKSDRRWPYDCKFRWETHLLEKKEGHKLPEQTLNLALSPSLSTRGTKRQAEVITASATSNVISGESKKRRRHLLVADTVRKTAKKRDNSTKSTLNPRKSSGLHETHNQYASLRPITPAELGAKKHEREELIKRQEAERRNQILAQRMGGMAVPMPNAAQIAAARQVMPNGQAIPQIRTSQVNISQQQRIATPTTAARIASPLNPQQARAMQAMATHPQAAQAQALAVQQQAAVANGMVNHHMSPPHVPRDATSSPAIVPLAAAQSSPPRTSVTPSNSSPVPLPAQVNVATAGVPARPTSVTSMNAYYPVMQNQYTPEQYMRILQHAQQQQQHLAHQQQVAQQQAQAQALAQAQTQPSAAGQS